MNHTIKTSIIIGIFALILFLPEVALAKVSSDNLIGGITDLYSNSAKKWIPTLKGFARKVFFILVGINLAWSMIQMIFKDEGIQGFIAELVRQVIFIGFYLMLLENGYNWAGKIIFSFMTAADQASVIAGGTANPSGSNVFEVGLELMKAVLSNMSILSPIDSKAIFLAALIIIIIFALISALVIISLVEIWIVLSAGTLILGLSGTRWSSEFALNYYKYALSAGIKIFTLMLLISVGDSVIRSWAKNLDEAELIDIFTLIGVVLIFYKIVESIPSTMQTLVQGGFAQGGHSNASTAIGGMASFVAGAATGAIGAGMAVKEAGKLASAQAGQKGSRAQGMSSKMGNMGSKLGGKSAMGQKIGGAIGQKLGGALAVAAGTASNLVSSGKESYSEKMSHKSIGGKMAHDMRKERKDDKSESKKGNYVSGINS